MRVPFCVRVGQPRTLLRVFFTLTPRTECGKWRNRRHSSAVSPNTYFTTITHVNVHVHVMWCHRDMWDGGRDELRLVDGTYNVHVTIGHTLNGEVYARTIVQH